MKRLFFIFLAMIPIVGIVAQTAANDDCTTAQAIGSLPVPSACPFGVGASLNIAGTLNGATPANPYTSNVNGKEGMQQNPARPR